MMKMKSLNKLLAMVMVIVFCSNLIVPIAGSELSELTSSYININKAYLTIDGILEVEHSPDITLEYYVGEEKIETDELILREQYLEKWITVKGYDAEGAEYEDKAYFSRLPVLYINTDDGRPVTSKNNYKSGTMFVQNNGGSASAEYDGVIQIKGRGNTSWAMPKKPYKIKLDKKADLFGMGKNKHWVLIANYIDESLLRNKTAYDLSKELGLESMDSVWTDLVLNGEYVGNYLLCEHIRIGDTRVNIFDWESEAEDIAKAIVKAEKKLGNILDRDALEERLTTDLSWITTGSVEFEGSVYSTGKNYDDISGGYLFELSNEYDEISKFTTDTGLKVMIKSPEYLNTNSDMMDFVTDYWRKLETAYMSEDGYVDTDGERTHYSELVDIDSAVSYWLVVEIMGNNDAVYKSRFAYMDKGSKLFFGPAWDFDWGCGASVVGYSPTVWKVSRSSNEQSFYKEFLDDPYFIAKATEKYWEIRPYLEYMIRNGGILDGNIEYLYESGKADETRWDRREKWPDTARGFETDAAIFKQYMAERVEWLDAQFATDKTLLGSVYTTASAYPYQKASNRLSVSLDGAEEDALSAHAPADAVVCYGDDTEVSIVVNDTITSTLNVYINGIYFDSYSVSGRKVSFVLDSGSLTEELGKKNVISLIGKDSDGATTYKNYYTVIQKERPPVRLGDVNGDGVVNLKDLIVLKKVISSQEVVYNSENADMNGDGAINISDINALKYMLVS